MLEQLDEVQWSGGTHIYGTSDMIPFHIRNLLSETKIEREVALDYLFGCQQDMGSVTAYTPRIIPFMLELLAAPNTPEKAGILFGMGWLADIPYWHPGERGTYGGTYILQTLTALEVGISLYVTLLNATDANTRYAAAFVLWHFPAFANQIIGPLESALTAENDASNKAYINEALGRLRNVKWQTGSV